MGMGGMGGDMDAMMNDPEALEQMQGMMQHPMMQQMLQDPQVLMNPAAAHFTC
jgi:hypothetical protein